MIFTSHGHRIPGTVYETIDPDQVVVSCGGLTKCEACRIESDRALVREINESLIIPLIVNGVRVGNYRIDEDDTFHPEITEDNSFAQEIKQALSGPYLPVEELRLEDFAVALAPDSKGKHAVAAD